MIFRENSLETVSAINTGYMISGGAVREREREERREKTEERRERERERERRERERSNV